MGRGSELDQLEDLHAPLWFREGTGIIAVSGDPGNGKSRLIAALEHRLLERDPEPVWLHGQADEIRTQPLATLRDALAGYFGSPGGTESEKKMDTYFAQILTLPVRAAHTLTALKSEVIEDAIRRDLGLDLMDRLWARIDLSKEEAMDLAIDAQEAARRTKPAQR